MSAQGLRVHIPFANLLHSVAGACRRAALSIQRAQAGDQIASPLGRPEHAGKIQGDSFWKMLNWDQFRSQNLPSPGSILARNANDPSRW